MAINVFVKGGGATLEEITATIDKVLSGYTYNDSEGEIQTGTMTNKGAVTGSVGVGGTYTNTGGYYSSISVTGPTLSGNATTAQVLKGQTFYSSNGTKQTGAMNSNGAFTKSVGVGGSVTGVAGYYSSISVTGPTLSGNAPVSAVRSGYTFYSSNGTKQTGTLATRSPSATTVPNGGSVTGSAGYYAAFTIKATYAVQRVTKAMNGYWANSGIVASGYWGASAANAQTSFKVVSSGGYIWHSRNQGSNCNLYITRVYTY
jgi:hypothetical protein